MPGTRRGQLRAAPRGRRARRRGAADLDPVLDVPVELTVEIGRTTMTIRETLDIGPGSIITLDRWPASRSTCS